MRFEMVMIDVRDLKAKTGIEKDLNVFVSKLEKNGYVVIGEMVAPESDSVKNYFLFSYDKGEAQGLEYKFLVFDVRGGPFAPNNELNKEVMELEKSGREIVRYYFMPRNNSAFTQILLAHVPKKVVKKKGEM